MITNKRVLDFLEKHPQIDVNVLMLLAIDMYEYVLSTQTNVNVNQISKYLLENSSKLDILLKQNTDLVSNLQDIKTSYISEVKNLLYDTDKTDKIIEEMRNSNFLLLNATRESLNEIIPKLNDIERRELEIKLKNLEANINIETSNLVKTLGTDNSVKNFTDIINNRCNDLSSHILNILNSNEQRLNVQLTDLKDITSGYNNLSMNLNNNVSQLLDKFNNSCQKGKISENLLSNILTKIYPSGDIIDMSELDHSCDLKLVRLGKADILFENKNYSNNVKSEEVKKFQDDMAKHDQHGIMLSQAAGIINKRDFEIEIKNQKVLLYLHNVNYDQDKIKLAVDVIDNINETLKTVEDKDAFFTLNNDVIKEINNEYLNFIKMREGLVTFLRDSNNEAIIKIKNLQFPRIEHLFVNRVESSNKEKVYSCKTCKNYTCTNRKDLNKHKQECCKI